MTPSSPEPELEAAVVVPARDEGGRVTAALLAVVRAAAEQPGRTRVVVVDDASADDTPALAAAALANAPWIDARFVHGVFGRASLARQAGVDALADMPDSTIVLSTDADTVVRSDWIRRHRDHHRRGAVAVAGIVDLIDDGDGRRVRTRWAPAYASTLRSDGTHPHVHAANLSIHLGALRSVGGFGSAERAEDIELWQRVRAAGLEPVADATIVVDTSARLQGRVSGGFAAALGVYREPSVR